MKYKILVEIEGTKPTPIQLANVKCNAEEAILEAINYKATFINTIVVKESEL